MKALANNIWIVEKEFSFIGADFGNRMTVTRLPSGAILLHSPVEYSDEISNEIDSLGEVAFIVTPNNFHGLFVDQWIEKYSRVKHFTTKPDELVNSYALTEGIEEDLESAINVIKIEGMSKLNEFVFRHKESSTLILTDLAFNFDKDISLWSKLFFKLNGCYEKFGPSRLMKTMIDSPDKLIGSIARINELSFTRIIVSHGNVVELQAKQIFCSAFNEASIGFAKNKSKSKFSLAKCG